VGKTAEAAWIGEWGDSKLKEAKISSNSDMVDDVTEVTAASTFARHCETMLSLDSMTSENVAWSSLLQAMAESRSSCITIGLVYGMAGWVCRVV